MAEARQVQTEYCFIKRTYYVGLVNGALYMGVMALVDPNTVIPALAERLTGSVAMAGAIVSLISLGWNWPPLLVANLVEHKPRKMPYYKMAASFRIIFYAVATAAIFVLGNQNGPLLFWIVALGMFAYTSAGGVAWVPFMDVVAKCVPPEKRGSFFGGRRLWAGAGALPLSLWVVTWVLDPARSGLAFPYNYGWLFVMSLVGVAIALGVFFLAEEPETVSETPRTPLMRHLARSWRLVKHDRDYAYYLVMRSLMYVSYMVCPLFTVYALRVLRMPEAAVGTFTWVSRVSVLIWSYLWAIVGDRKGNRMLLLASSAVMLLTPVAALIAPLLPRAPVHAPALYASTLPQLFFLSVFVFAGVAGAGSMIGTTNYVLDLAPERRRPTYIGFVSTFGIPFTMLTWVAGILVKWIGFTGVFAISGVASVAVIWVTYLMGEPRTSRRNLGARVAQTSGVCVEASCPSNE